MKIKLIDFGYKKAPHRAHYNDAGADVYALEDTLIPPHTTGKVRLGFGLKVPDGYAAFVYPRSSMAAKSAPAQLPPIDSGYRGEIHAIVSNTSAHPIGIEEGDRVGQLVIVPVVIAEYTEDKGNKRGAGAFGSTGK